MTDGTPDLTAPASLWKVRISTIIWAALILGCLIALPVILDATFLLIIAALFVAGVAGAGIAWLYRRYKGTTGHGFGHDWVKSAIATFCLVCIAMAAPIYYFAIRTAIDPPLLPRAVLTNGQKTVVFQGMMHVGTQQFYKQVVFDLEQALADGYVLYYEGVQPNPKGDQWFSKTLAGGGDLSANYRVLGKLCGLNFQSDYFGLLEADKREHPDRHVIADVDTWQMQQEFDRLKRSDPEFAARIDAELAERNSDSGSDPIGDSIASFDQFTDGQLKLMGYYCRDTASNIVRSEKKPTQLGKVILEFRNRELARRILADAHDKIYVTYGADHLNGVFALLKQEDSRWQIQSVSWTSPVEAPRQLKGTL